MVRGESCSFCPDFGDWNCPHFDKLKIKPKEGDLIEVCMHDIGVTQMSHWAVYVGCGEVIHLCNTGGQSGSSGIQVHNIFSSTGEIKKDDMGRVINGRKWRVNNSPPRGSQGGQKNPETIRDEALKAYEESQNEKVPYSPLSRNCEHFAKEMGHGQPTSQQADVAKNAIIGTGIFAFGVAAFAWLATLFSSGSDSEKQKKRTKK